MREYLDNGGKIVWLGGIPNLFRQDETGRFRRVHKIGEDLLGVDFQKSTESGNYYSKATQEGLNWGLNPWLKTTSTTVSSEGVIPLAIDEYGRISAWRKEYYPRPGAGFISCRTWAVNVSIKESDLELIHNLALFGLE